MSIRVMAAIALAVIGGAAVRAWATIGLSSQFVNAVMENLQPGRTYNLRELRGVPYTVKNRGDGTVEVLVESQVPVPKELFKEYEAVPDPTWMEINPPRYRLGPGEVGFSDLIIRVPDDAKLLGKHFQVAVWAHTVETGFLAAAVRSQIRFSIGKGPDTLEAEAKAKSMVDLNYDLWPTAMSVTKAKVGKNDVKKLEKKSFKLTNRSEKELELVFGAIPWQGSTAGLPPGFEKIEDLSWVSFEPRTVKVDAETLEEVRVILNVPEKLRGKKVGFQVQLALPIGTIVNVTTRMYVQVEP